jgi:hypothetical protein
MKSTRLLLILACAANVRCFAAPARSSGPSESKGVQMNIAGQFCEDSIQPADNDLGTLRMRLKIAIANHGDDAVTFDPQRVKLVVPDGTTPRPVEADSPVVVGVGQTKVTQVRFMSRISVKCKQEMKLDPGDSIVAGATRVPLPPIAFVAQN